jgi:hypothetical protein
VPGAEEISAQLQRNGIDGACLQTNELTDDNLRFAFGIDFRRFWPQVVVGLAVIWASCGLNLA